MFLKVTLRWEPVQDLLIGLCFFLSCRLLFISSRLNNRSNLILWLINEGRISDQIGPNDWVLVVNAICRFRKGKATLLCLIVLHPALDGLLRILLEIQPCWRVPAILFYFYCWLYSYCTCNSPLSPFNRVRPLLTPCKRQPFLNQQCDEAVPFITVTNCRLILQERVVWLTDLVCK